MHRCQRFTCPRVHFWPISKQWQRHVVGHALVEGPPVDYSYRDDVMADTASVIGASYPDLLDLVDNGAHGRLWYHRVCVILPCRPIACWCASSMVPATADSEDLYHLEQPLHHQM